MKRNILALVIFLGLVLAGCSTVEPNPGATATTAATATITITSTPTTLPSPTPVPATATATFTPRPTSTPTLTYPLQGYGPTAFPTNIDPLTGLVVADPKLLDRRPMSIKINIVPRNRERPTWGLSLADIVYEFYHNDGYSRFHAIFYGQDTEEAGSIRSGRLFDDPLIQIYKSIFVYGGADPTIDSRFLNSTYANRLVRERGSTFTCPPDLEHPLCRFDPNGYDNLLANTADVHLSLQKAGIDDSRQNLDGMLFKLNTPPGGATANTIFTRYSGDDYSRWDYDAVSGRYLRFQDNVFDQGQGEQYTPLMDRVTEQQITADNVVVLLVPHSYFRKPPAEIIEIMLNGTGKAYAFRDGQVYEVQWNRPKPDSVLYLTLLDGTLYPFKPGNTWFEVVGESSVTTNPESTSWRFNFKIP